MYHNDLAFIIKAKDFAQIFVDIWRYEILLQLFFYKTNNMTAKIQNRPTVIQINHIELEKNGIIM